MARAAQIDSAIDCLYGACLLLWVFLFLWMFLAELAQPRFFDTHLLDFSRFYSVGQLIVSPDRSHVYDPAVQYAWLSKNLADMPVLGQNRPALLKFFNEQPPPFFLIFTPFTFMKQQPAFCMAMLLFLAVCCVSVVCLGRCRSKRLSPREVFAIIMAGCASGPAAAGLVLGQPNWLIAGIAGLYFAAFLSGRDILAGICLAAVAIKPQYALFWIIPVLATKRWKLLGALAAGGAIMLAVSILLIGPRAMLGYPAIVIENDLAPAHFYTKMISFRGIMSMFFEQNLVLRMSSVFMAATIALIAVLWARTRAASAAWAVSLTLLLSLLGNPHTYVYDCLLLIIPAALTLDSLSLVRAARQELLCKRVWELGLLLYPLVSTVLFFAIRSDEPKTGLLVAYNAVLCACAFLMWRSSNSQKAKKRTISGAS